MGLTLVIYVKQCSEDLEDESLVGFVYYFWSCKYNGEN